MNKKEIKASIVLILIFTIIGVILFKLNNNNKNNYINKNNVRIINDEVLLLSNSEKKKCIDGLIKHLNDEYYYICNKIEFYNNTFDESTNEKYFYALAIGQDESLIEITNLGNGNFKYQYIGNQLTPNSTSDITGVTYQQIVNPDKYQYELELEEIREEGKNALPDDTEMP